MGLLAAGLAGLAVWFACPARPMARRFEAHRAAAVVGAGVTAVVLVSGSLPPRVLVVLAAGVACAVGGRLIWVRRRGRQLRTRTSASVLEVCEILAAELSAGRPPGLALEEAALRWPEFAPVSDAWSMGSDVAEALRRVALLPGAQDLRIVAGAWQVAHHSGTGLAHALSRVSDRVRCQRQTQRVVTSELASARATARLVAALPVVALGMGSGAGGSPWRFLLDTPIGWGCLLAGIGFAVAGLWWIELIADRVQQ